MENNKSYLKDDLRRYGITQTGNFVFAYLKSPQIRFLVAFRKAGQYKKYTIRGLFYRLIHRHYAVKYGFQIPVGTRIGRGFYLGHWGCVVVNDQAIMGDNCNIAQGVTIGQTNRGMKCGVPVIGNQVWIGANAVLVGKIRIGNDVLIAPNSYVNIDVPDHSVALGNPAQIIPKENATEGYINNIV